MKEPFDYEAAKVDTVPAATQPGDYVIPVEIQNENRGLMAQVKRAVANSGADPEAHVAGSPRGNYNPQTGQQHHIRRVVRRVGRAVRRAGSSVARAGKRVLRNPIVRTAAIGAGMFFGVPAAAGALGIGKAGAAGAAAAAAGGAGKIGSTAAWWSGTMGMGAGGAAARAAGTPGLFGARTAATMGAQQISGPALQGMPGLGVGGGQVQQQGGFMGGRFGSTLGNIWNGLGGAGQAALIQGGFGAVGGWADAKAQAQMRKDDRAHEMRMEEYKTDVERENFDDRNRLMGMGRDGQGGVEIDPNMVANWGLGDMSLPRRSFESYPPPNTPLSDKLREGFLSGGL